MMPGAHHSRYLLPRLATGANSMVSASIGVALICGSPIFSLSEGADHFQEIASIDTDPFDLSRYM
jgi:hypothetical protein